MNHFFCVSIQYIGSKEADRKADGAPQLGIHDLWTPENHYRWSISRYGGHVSASVQPVNPSRLFLCSMFQAISFFFHFFGYQISLDVGEIEKLRFRKKELEDNISSLEENFKILQTEQRHLEDEAAKLRKQRDDIINTVQRETNKRRDLEKRVNQRRMKLESIEKEDDLDTNINRLTDQAARLNMQRFQKAIEIKNLLIEAVILKWSFAEKQMMHIEHDVKIRQLEVNIKNQEKAALQASMHYENWWMVENWAPRRRT
ncbi:hypothetical protein GIB67_040054 [Kingdonia uniflora]|uniref:Uncharacterized protein n=1 Tax=Kingdonia uniflora TaxID=39325 RepID=A0A7J7MUT2_9MAGN|nr:hypothetical protein GIB67_040054 [Kingdonia uniflora]